MLIDCPSCARSYHVGRADIGESGRILVCPRCEASWFVDAEGTHREPPAAVPEIHLTATRTNPRELDWASSRPAMLPRLRWPFAAAACILLVAGSLAARERVVRSLPRTAGVYQAIGLPVNVRGLEFANVSARVEAPVSDIAVSGEIRNVAHRRMPVQRIAYDVLDASGASVASWSEAAPTRMLASRASVAFASQPHAIPSDGRTVLVRFDDDRGGG